MVVVRGASPGYFRKRAEEFRTKAGIAERRQAREILRKAAKAYDDLARLAEQIRAVQDLRSRIAKMLH